MTTSTTCSNLVVLRGIVGASIAERQLPSGGTAVQFDVRTDAGSVNVSLVDPPHDVRGVIEPGEEMLVIGTVERRFFRVRAANVATQPGQTNP